MVKHGVGDLVDNVGGRVDLEAGPLLHGGAVDGFLVMLYIEHQVRSARCQSIESNGCVSYSKCHP